MLLTTKRLIDELNRGDDLSPVEREYGEWVDDDPYGDGPWPSAEEMQLDAERSDFNK